MNARKWTLIAVGLALLQFGCATTSQSQKESIPEFCEGARILFQGDSITDGNRGRNTDPNHILGHGYQALISSRYGADLPERHLTFLNRGISGNTVSALAQRWQTDTIDLKPDILSILIGVNDLSRGVSAEQYEQQYDQLLADTVNALPNVKLVLCEPFGLPVGQKKSNWEDYRSQVSVRDGIVTKLGGKYHAPVVHFQRMFESATHRAPAEYWIWDGVHPTYAGHQLMADEWVRTVRSYQWGKATLTAETPPPVIAAPAGKVAPWPLYRDPVFDAPTDPVICYNAESHKWFMYYTARRATATNTPGVTWVHGSKIGIAESSDGGATWTYRGTADISYGKDTHPDDYTYWAPEVIWVEGTYHMYLSYVPGIFTDWNHPREIVHLISKDGLKWKTIAKVDLKSDKTIDACVIQLPNGAWRMWYKDEEKPRSLCFADSPYLDNWEAKGTAVTDFSGEGPKIIRWKGSYWLIADCWQNGMRVWKSEDCLNWKLQEEALFGSHGDVVISGDRAWWFYFGGPLPPVAAATNNSSVQPSAHGAQGRTTAISVVELSVINGKLIPGDPSQPTYIDLKPLREEEK